MSLSKSNIVDLPVPSSSTAGGYQRFRNESDSDISHYTEDIDNELSHSANKEVRKWLKGQGEDTVTAAGGNNYLSYTRHNIAIPSQYIPVSVASWREDDDARPAHKPAWEVAAKQHPQFAMKNSKLTPARPTKSAKTTKSSMARQYFKDRLALFIGLAMICTGVLMWILAVSHKSPIARWAGCMVIVVGVGWLIVDCINVSSRK